MTDNIQKVARRAAALAALRVVHAAWMTAWPMLAEWREYHDPEDPTREDSFFIETLFSKIEKRIKSR